MDQLTQMKQLTTEQRNERKGLKQELSKSLTMPQMLGKQNVHALHTGREGQFAADLSATDGIDGRGMKRVVFDRKGSATGGDRFKIAGVTLNHRYDQIPAYGQVPVPELKQVQPFFVNKRRIKSTLLKRVLFSESFQQKTN